MRHEVTTAAAISTDRGSAWAFFTSAAMATAKGNSPAGPAIRRPLPASRDDIHKAPTGPASAVQTTNFSVCPFQTEALRREPRTAVVCGPSALLGRPAGVAA